MSLSRVTTPNDLERAAKSSFSWETEEATLKSLGDDTLAIVLERKRALKAGVALSDYDKRIKDSLGVLKAGIGQLEQRLSEAEDTGGRNATDLRRWEEAILQLSKQYDRLEFMVRAEDEDNPSARRELFTPPPRAQPSGSSRKDKSVRFTSSSEEDGDGSGLELQSGEMLTLQKRIIDDQDAQLDLLSETISRQKQLGMMISDELDLHVDLLEETEERVDATGERLRGAGRRLGDVSKAAASSSRGTTVIIILVIILMIVIVMAKKL
ncbi:hypothetical protein HK104_008990 [Borealophlyctis nickersoniae]|nr:hypothetical protein HK104_008990 [Borealophlyctis nickersoniae]